MYSYKDLQNSKVRRMKMIEMKKKVFAALLFVILSLILIPGTAFAGDEDYSINVKGSFDQRSAYECMTVLEKQTGFDLIWDSSLEDIAMREAVHLSVSFNGYYTPNGEMQPEYLGCGNCDSAYSFIYSQSIDEIKRYIEEHGKYIGVSYFTSRNGIGYWTLISSKVQIGNESAFNRVMTKDSIAVTVNDYSYCWDAIIRNSSGDLVGEKNMLTGKTYYCRPYIDNAISDETNDRSDFTSMNISSSNPSVIKVYSNGKMVTKKAGFARITVSPSKSSNCERISHYCVVRPAKVTGVKTYTVSSSSINIIWNKVSGAKGYRVYRSKYKNSGYKLVKTITSGSTTSYRNSGLKSGTKYYYIVSGYVSHDGQKYEGTDSNAASSTTTKIVKAKKPSSSSSSSSYTVYITRTGECYHRGSCRYLYASKIPISKSRAISIGYRACKVCRP